MGDEFDMGIIGRITRATQVQPRCWGFVNSSGSADALATAQGRWHREITHRSGIMINDTERASVHHVSRQPASGAAGPRLYLLDREAWIIPR
jgi:hypothetical protein